MDKPKFYIWNAANPQEYQAWIAVWKNWHQGEIYAHPDYLRLYLGAGDKACCAFLQLPTGFVLYPFILRDLSYEPYWDSSLPPLSDITSAYGYGGAYVQGNMADRADEFWSYFDIWASQTNVVSEFVRFSLFKETLLPYWGDIEQKQDNIVCDINLSLDSIWMNFRHKVRKNVKRAQKNQIRIDIDESAQRLDDFLHIYRSTMKRRNAKKQYYFSRQYFENLNHNLAGQYIYFHALHNDTVVASELVLVSANTVYSFLGGTIAEAFHLRPNDLLKYEIIKWAKASGKSRFVLGGGYEANDGIYKYKESFSPSGKLPFFVGKRILKADFYEELVHRRKAMDKGLGLFSNAYFPAYREPITDES
jgi:GNAT acetyltransferase-like protein